MSASLVNKFRDDYLSGKLKVKGTVINFEIKTENYKIKIPRAEFSIDGIKSARKKEYGLLFSPLDLMEDVLDALEVGKAKLKGNGGVYLIEVDLENEGKIMLTCTVGD